MHRTTTRLVMLLACAFPLFTAAASHDLATFVGEYDLDRNGSVSKEEFQQERTRRFAATDTDRDGVISEREYVDEFRARLMFGNPDEAGIERQMQQTVARFKVLDSNQDARISPAEYQASGWGMFGEHDYNLDGAVSMADKAGATPPTAAAPTAATAPAAASPRVQSRYTFTWPTGPSAPAPRGGSTRGAPVELQRDASPEWRALQESGLSAQERDRRAILAMAGNYRVSFDFLEVAAFTGDGSRAQPYQSWGTERVFVDRNEPDHVSLVHILEMHVIGPDGNVMEPMITRHWRQDWRYQPAYIVEYQGGEQWVRRRLPDAERQGHWVQMVHQVDEAPRYAALGKWEHNATYSTWIGDETARPLPRREWSVRKDYDLLRGTNRHTVLPSGWLHEENNLKATRDARQPFVGREYGVARYERIQGDFFTGATKYFEATRAYWREVLRVWDDIWSSRDTVTLKASSDQSGAFADLFGLADEYASGRLDLTGARARVRASLDAQMRSGAAATTEP